MVIPEVSLAGVARMRVWPPPGELSAALSLHPITPITHITHLCLFCVYQNAASRSIR